jgi:hypothetical protein
MHLPIMQTRLSSPANDTAVDNCTEAGYRTEWET